MKIVCISHAYVIEPYTLGLVDLAVHPDVEQLIVLPRRFRNKIGPGIVENWEKRGYKIFFCRTFLNWHNSIYTYSPSLFIKLIKFKPDIIYIGEEPWSLSTFMISWFSKSFLKMTKLIISTWENIERRYPLPSRLMEQYVLNHVNLIITPVMQGAIEILRKKGYEKDIEICVPAIDPTVFKRIDVNELKGRLGLKDVFVIGYIGRIVEEKGLELLIDAVAKINVKKRFLIIGDGPFKNRIKEKTIDSGIGDETIFVGKIPHHQLPEYLNCMDVLVLPSMTTKSWKEQFGRVLIEAMACEVAVVGSTSGEIPTVIGPAGLLFKEGDVTALYEILMKVINDPELLLSLKKKGRAYVINHYAWHAISEQMYQLYVSRSGICLVALLD